MSFLDLKLKHSYNSEKDSILDEFYIPILAEAKCYQRITGYFSSQSFIIAAKGFAHFISHNGKLQFILNVKLANEDYDAILAGYNKPNELIESLILDDLFKIENEFIKNHLKVIGWLIAHGNLEIKIGYIKNKLSGNEILHQKVGILQDFDGNIITFSGSNNESVGGWLLNSEKFKVFFSWEEGNQNYINQDIQDFSELWNNSSPKTDVFTFPEAVKNHLIEIAPKNTEEFNAVIKRINQTEKSIKLRQYQHDAINSWFKNNCNGIFEMATGTGKTFTAIEAMNELFKREKKIVAIISCPFLHLCHQWIDSIQKMNVPLPIIQASSINSKWKDELNNLILENRLGRINQFIVVVTHDTASSENFRKIIDELKCEILFIGDEVHALGSTNHIEALLPKYKYRLGLSATPSRYFDEIGTNKLLEYFNETVFVFDLEQAINEINSDTNESYLCPYEYYPIFVELSDEEMENYDELSKIISILFLKKDKTQNEEAILERKLMERADILKNANNKFVEFSVLLDSLLKEDDVSHTLVYCSPQQIQKAQQIIRNKGKIIQHKFTGEENATVKREKYGNKTEREYLLDNFDRGFYDVLVAIKCLDEGVDVPSTKNAILLCSSGNPKEYIQRRGRVLRRHPGKDKAIIYDFTAIPKHSGPRWDANIEKKIIENQLSRIKEFSCNALNQSEILRAIFQLQMKYNL